MSNIVTVVDFSVCILLVFKGYLFTRILFTFAIPKTRTKNRSATSSATKVFAGKEIGTISPYPTDENVIKLK